MVTPTEALPDGSIARKAVRAVALNYLAWFLGKAVVLISTAVLARLLSPDEFGLVGFATVAVAYLAVLQDLGLGAALIQRRDDLDDAADTVFTLNLVVGVLLAVTMALLAPSVASFFDEPAVAPLVRALSVTFVLNALATTHSALLERGLAFSRKLVPDVGSAIVKGAIGIGCAFGGLGAWSLVWGQIAGSVAVVVLSWAVMPWRPRIRVRRSIVGSLTRFGGAVLVADLVHAAAANLDYVVVGKVLGGTALGIYVLAYRLPELLLLGVVRVLNRAVFPAFASVQDRAETLRRGFLATVRYVPLVVVPVAIGLVLAADPIVRALLGEQWLDAIPVMRIIALSALVSSLMVSDGDVYKATGRPDVLARFAFLKLVLLVPALLVAAQHGLVWVAGAHLATTILVKVARARAAARMIGVGWRDLGSAMSPVVMPAVALVVVASTALALTGDMSSMVQLLVVSGTGASAYGAVLVAREGGELAQLGSLLRRQDLPRSTDDIHVEV
jgi:PST family polysaccharide transporter